MSCRKTYQKRFACLITLCIFLNFSINCANAKDLTHVNPGNFGLPGIIDLPTAKRFSDGELVLTQQLHKSLSRSGISFQALPRTAFSFRYTGHGIGGGEAYGRVNHDRSFDAHISIIDEGKYLPAISLGLRDFIGTGWYSSEYFVTTKTLGDIELTAGLGFGRLAGKNSFSNPLSAFSSYFDQRDVGKANRGGTLGTINWFEGEASVFYGLNYQVGEKALLSFEYSPDLMSQESRYLDVKSPLNFAFSYKLNKYLTMSAQYLHGSQISISTQATINPGRAPLIGGKELAPVPMRSRGKGALPIRKNDENLIKKVLKADEFDINHLEFDTDTVTIIITNTKFRSTAQAVGRVASTLQRFTSDDIKFAHIFLRVGDVEAASYRVDLESISTEQLNPLLFDEARSSVSAIDLSSPNFVAEKKQVKWGIGPYFTHRLFNPDLPFSMEAGIEASGSYQLIHGLSFSGSIRKSIVTNLTDNNRRSNSRLPRVHSDWALYDFAGQGGHIHQLKLSYVKKISQRLYGRAHAGFLEPFFAGVGAEVLYKPAKSPIGIGLDIHRVRKRDYDMRFDLRDYETTVGHMSFYYDAGGMFDVEVNAGRYLAGDWGVTTTISRKFGSGWEVGGYATLTDVPFDTFGEGSFDKAIYVSVPIDWIISSPSRSKRRLTIRPITRDGGAQLSSARKLYRTIEDTQNAEFKREFGRLWR